MDDRASLAAGRTPEIEAPAIAGDANLTRAKMVVVMNPFEELKARVSNK